jgi:hypothetical protein
MGISADATTEMLVERVFHAANGSHGLLTARLVPFPDIAFEAVMNSPAPLPAHRVDRAPSHALADCAQQTVTQLHEAAREPAAQNGPDPKIRIEPPEADDFRSPLWTVAIGTACLFAAMAAVMAFG